jgi:adenine-specific DNA methylase
MPVPSPSTPIHARQERCLLEADFPYCDLSALTRADRSLADPVYGAHKWWARRPRAVIRALVLAAHLPANTTADEFWSRFADDRDQLSGARVGDCFAGGGTTLVEAARLGASVVGIDVDPLAVRIVRDELAAPPSPADLDAAATAMLAALNAQVGDLYPAADETSLPLHYFWLRRVDCVCGTPSLLHRSLVLARDSGAAGAVVRDGKQVAFCPQCRALHELATERKTLQCCGRRWPLDTHTFGRSGHRCPGCLQRRTLEQLQAGALPEVLIAVEDTVDGGRRRLRPPTPADAAALDLAAERVRGLDSALPSESLDGVDDGRPASYGFATVADLFSSRQQLLFAKAISHLENADLDGAVLTRLELALSNAVHTNNRLCGYATDYGRLAAAFAGVRSYSLPALTVELNPLHPSAGRGTLPAMMRRLQRSGAPTTKRRVLRAGVPAEVEMLARRDVDAAVRCWTADRRLPAEFSDCTAIVTDPPYYDYISYSDLSLLARAWLRADDGAALGGRPIFPVGDDARTAFSKRLARALRHAGGALVDDGVLTFTYHSAHEDGWVALGDAVAAARLVVTAVFPVWADARSNTAHGHPGSCEWDLVWVCRRAPAIGAVPETIEAWVDTIGASVGEADLRNLALGLAAARRVNGAADVA